MCMAKHQHFLIVQLPQQDYENSSMAYVELHGDAVACVKGLTSDLVTDSRQEGSLKMQSWGGGGGGDLTYGPLRGYVVT